MAWQHSLGKPHLISLRSRSALLYPFNTFSPFFSSFTLARHHDVIQLPRICKPATQYLRAVRSFFRINENILNTSHSFPIVFIAALVLSLRDKPFKSAMIFLFRSFVLAFHISVQSERENWKTNFCVIFCFNLWFLSKSLLCWNILFLFATLFVIVFFPFLLVFVYCVESSSCYRKGVLCV